MSNPLTVVAYLPGTSYVFVRTSEGKLGMYDSQHDDFEERPEYMLQSAIAKYGYQPLEPQVTATPEEIPTLIETLEKGFFATRQ